MSLKHSEVPEKPPYRELDIDSLPLPPTADEVMDRNPMDCPLTEKDFQRVKNFFDTQVIYYESLAKEETEPMVANMYRKWAKRIPELFELIRANVRIITKEMFDHSVVRMRDEINQFVGSEPFLCFLHGKDMDEAKNHSTYYVARQIGVPEDCFVTDSDLERPEIQDFIKKGGKIVITDDAVYGAANLHLHINTIKGEDRRIEPGQILVSLVGITDKAMEYITGWGIPMEVRAQYRIPLVNDVLQVTGNVNDYRIMRFMERRGYGGREEQLVVLNEQVLTLFWQKVPDNFVKALRKVDNRWSDGKKWNYWDGWLVDDTPEGIHPNYREGRTFQHS